MRSASVRSCGSFLEDATDLIPSPPAYNIDPKLQVWCMGSYRRGAETCGDIDLIVTRDPSDGKTHEGAVQKLWKGLVAEKMVRHELTVPEDWRSLDALYVAIYRTLRKQPLTSATAIAYTV